MAEYEHLLDIFEAAKFIEMGAKKLGKGYVRFPQRGHDWVAALSPKEKID